jgi:hypothetical protein
MKAESQGSRRTDTQNEARHHLIPEIQALRWVGLDALDELGGELAFHKLMIRQADLSRQGQV